MTTPGRLDAQIHYLCIMRTGGSQLKIYAIRIRFEQSISVEKLNSARSLAHERAEFIK